MGRILNHLRQAEALAEALGDQRRLAQLAGYLSVSLRRQGHIDEALVSAQRALAIGTALGDIGLQVATNSFLGELYLWVLNDYRQAAEVFRRNVEILHGALLRERFGTTNVQSVVSRAQVARCLAELGEFAEGRAYGEDALRLAETVDHPYSLIWACNGLAILPAPGCVVPGHTRVGTGAGAPRSCELPAAYFVNAKRDWAQPTPCPGGRARPCHCWSGGWDSRIPMAYGAKLLSSASGWARAMCWLAA